MSPKTNTAALQISSDIHHDLRTPLNQIIGYSEMLTEEANETGQTAFLADLEKIHQAAHTLLNLLDTLFTVNRQETEQPPRSATVPAIAAKIIPQAANLSDVTPAKILLVDDNATNLDVLARRLERQGHLTTMAENGFEALEKLQKSAFDLVLLDIMMPEMDGYEVLTRMKADPILRQVPVIMISALTEMDSIVKCIELGAEDYLPKPFNPTLLRARINATLERKRLYEQEQAYREQVLQTEAAQEKHLALAQMVAGVAHEVNTPLGIANTAVNIIENRLTSAKIRQLFTGEENLETLEDVLDSLTLMKSNIIRAHKLVESFKKISVGQATDKQEIVDLPDLLNDCVELFKINARQAKITISIDNSRLSGSREWFGYPGEMIQVISNLLQNVERYAYPNAQGGAVEICIFDENNQFGITVRDYGQGISAENLAKIFDPFFTTGRGKGGSGLGLSIVNNIVTTLFKGRISVVSEPGKGCCFSLFVPKML